jgi:CheY-like chemotaxis protein
LVAAPKEEEDKRIQILIVDDNIFNLTTLQTMIKIKFKIESLIASSGEAALDHLKQRI